jgi:hypothetical protein
MIPPATLNTCVRCKLCTRPVAVGIAQRFVRENTTDI